MVVGKDKPIRVSELIELEHDPPVIKQQARREGLARPASDQQPRIVAQYTSGRRRRWRGKGRRSSAST